MLLPHHIVTITDISEVDRAGQAGEKSGLLLPHHTATFTDISEVDLAGQSGLRIGRSQVCYDATTLSLSQTYHRWALLVSVVSG